MAADIHAAGRDFVEQRLPQMGARLFDKRDIRKTMPPEAVAETCDELQPAGTAADYDDAVEVRARTGRSRRSVRLFTWRVPRLRREEALAGLV
jgi:hypothetical protein